MKKVIVAYLLTIVVLLGVAVVFGPTDIQAQGSGVVRVTRVPALSESPASFYGIDYPAGATFTVGASGPAGKLTISYGGAVVAVWAPGQWARVERLE